jgi:jumonji domain-containing protein 2
MFFLFALFDIVFFLFVKLFQVVSPKEWTPRRNGYNDVDIMIPSPIEQCVMGSQGHYQQSNIQIDPIHIKQFEVLANSRK